MPPQHIPHCLQSCTCDVGYFLMLDAATDYASCELLSPPSHQLSTFLAATIPPVTLLLLGLAVLLHRSKGRLSTYANYFVKSIKPPGMGIATSKMACLLGSKPSSNVHRCVRANTSSCLVPAHPSRLSQAYQCRRRPECHAGRH